MRTKQLYLAAAALATSLLSAQAQSNVYSVNIVGYVNKPTPINGFISMANPLIPSGGNAATNVFPNAFDSNAGGGPLDGCALYLWNGLKFNIFVLDSTQPTGYADSLGNPLPTPTLAPGVGFLFNNQVGNRTNTFIGTVAATNNLAQRTLPSSPLLNLVASQLPLGGGITSGLQFTNVAGALDGQQIQTPNIVNGVLTSWNVVTFDSGMPSGFGDALDINPAPEPVIPVGSSFLFINNGATPVQWNQVIQ